MRDSQIGKQYKPVQVHSFFSIFSLVKSSEVFGSLNSMLNRIADILQVPPEHLLSPVLKTVEEIQIMRYWQDIFSSN